MLLTLIGELEIYYKFYGYWLFEVFAQLSFEIYITHGIVLNTVPFMTTVSYHHTASMYIWITAKHLLLNFVAAFLFKLIVTSPLVNITQILFGWDAPSKLKDKGTTEECKVKSDKVEQRKSEEKHVKIHVKQD